MKPVVEKIVDNLPMLEKAMEDLTRLSVLVGVPHENIRRDEGKINNATLAYTHDNGSPARNIPARPFMKPGIKAVQARVSAMFAMAARRALKDNIDVRNSLDAIGDTAASSIRNTIRQGIPPPLSPVTIARRRFSRKTQSMRKGEVLAGQLFSQGKTRQQVMAITGIKPLINTGSMLRSITFLVVDS
jgi:hypothetical protein